jgi:hypothetical protein
MPLLWMTTKSISTIADQIHHLFLRARAPRVLNSVGRFEGVGWSVNLGTPSRQSSAGRCCVSDMAAAAAMVINATQGAPENGDSAGSAPDETESPRNEGSAPRDEEGTY